MKLSDGEKLILVMLRDLYKHLGIKKSEIDPEFVAQSIWGDQLWGITERYGDGLNLTKPYEMPAAVEQTINILDMWSAIEDAGKKLSRSDKKKITDADVRFNHLQFPGFDGNNEPDHLRAANYLIEHLNRFTGFSKRDLNSHYEHLRSYLKMVRVFDPDMRKTLGPGKALTVEQIIEILKAAAE